MSALLLNDVIKPFKTELEETKIDLQRVSNLHHYYKNEDLAFVDIVLEGGGVKGVAVSGALYALETMGIRFRKIAGTSAGAINAVFLAICAENLAERRVEKLANIVFNMNLLKFVDGGRGAQAFVHAIMTEDQNLFNRLNKFVSFTRNIEKVVKNFGINPGESIHKWLCQSLARYNKGKALKVEDLLKKLYVPNSDIKGDFQLITTDITNRRKAQFPKELALYLDDVGSVLLADLVRASISIPFFFEPYKLGQFEYTGNFRYSDNLISNEKTTFIDGAMVSNFPLGIFDTEKERIPKCPTFGILFDNESEQDSHEINTIMDYFLAVFETMNEHGDRAYMFSTRAKSRIIKISNMVNDKAIRSIYFNLSPEEIGVLFGNGIRAALDFIKGWDFQNYIDEIRS